MSFGPAALAQSVPAALGRTPAEELVLVGVTNLTPEAAVIMTLRMATPDSPELDEALVIGAAMDQLRRDGATHVAVLVYAEDSTADSPAARYGATAVVCAEAAGLSVLDALAVTRGRWRSYECDNPSCCPLEGTPILEGPTP